jgi:hypothetical protein
MRRTLRAVAGAVCVVSAVSSALSAQQRLPRAEAGLSMLMSPAADSRIPELMVGPMLNITIGEAAGGVIGLEGAMRFRADGQQLLICPQPPGVICDARNVNTLTTAGLTYRRGFGAQPLRQGPTMRLGVGGAFTSLKGTATIYPNTDGSRPALAEIQKNAAVLDAGLGWIQRFGSVPLRIEGRVSGFAPELANTRYSYGVQFGLGY